MLFAFGCAADGIRFLKRTFESTGHKAPYLVDGHALIFFFHQMPGEVIGATALITDEDHNLNPSA